MEDVELEMEFAVKKVLSGYADDDKDKNNDDVIVTRRELEDGPPEIQDGPPENCVAVEGGISDEKGTELKKGKFSYKGASGKGFFCCKKKKGAHN